jgi:hypothetical protein
VAVAGQPQAAERTGGDELEVLVVADLDHEAVGVPEEEQDWSMGDPSTSLMVRFMYRMRISRSLRSMAPMSSH